MTQTIRDVLAQSASYGFVGREKEMAIMDCLLKQDGPFVMHIHGLAGIGKTTLLRAFTSRVRSDEVTAIGLECRSIEPTKRGFLQALGTAIGLGRAESNIERIVERLSAISGKVLLALDTFELLRLLDSWLRQEASTRLSPQGRWMRHGTRCLSDIGAGAQGSEVRTVGERDSWWRWLRTLSWRRHSVGQNRRFSCAVFCHTLPSPRWCSVALRATAPPKRQGEKSYQARRSRSVYMNRIFVGDPRAGSGRGRWAW